MFKNMRLVILFDMLLNPSFKMTTGFANVARTTDIVIFKDKIGINYNNTFKIEDKWIYSAK